MRCRGDRECERFQREQEKTEALLATLRKELADKRQKKARYVGNVRDSSSESEQGSLAEEPNATTGVWVTLILSLRDR